MSIEAELRDVITACVRAYINAGGKWSQLSEMSGVSVGALKKLTDHDTLHPRFKTIEQVLLAFGRELKLLQETKKVSPKRGGKRKVKHEDRAGVCI